MHIQPEMVDDFPIFFKYIIFDKIMRSIISIYVMKALLVSLPSYFKMKVHPEYIPPRENPAFTHLELIKKAAQIFGLCASLRSVLGWCIILMVFLIYSGFCIFTLINLNWIFSEHVSTILRIIEGIQLIMEFFSMTVYSLNAFNIHDRIESSITKLHELDILLASTYSKEVYKRIQLVVTAALQLSLYGTVIIGVFLGHVLAKHEIVHLPEVYYVIRFFPLFRIGILVIIFVTVIKEALFRFQSLNALIGKYLGNQAGIPVRHLHLISAVYELGFEITQELNGTFRICNLFQIGYCFISITAKIFFIFITLNNLDDATTQDWSKSLVIS